MAKEFTAESVEQQAAEKTQKSKYGILNTMTVDQLRRAKKILNGKLKDSKGETKTKIESMIGEYNRTERQIAKYYQTVTKHPKGTALLAARGKTLKNLTIQNIKGLTSINDKDLGTLDKNAFSKAALGLGIGLTAIGGGLIGGEDGIALFGLVKLFTKLWNNGAGLHNVIAASLIMAGGAAIGTSFIAKKVKENNAKKAAMQAKVNEAENEAFEAASAEESKVMATAMSQEEKDTLINEVSKDPSLIKHYQKIISTGQDKEGNRYSIQQRKDYLSVLQGVDAENKKLSDLVDEANKTAPATQKKEAKQTAAGTSEKVGKGEIGDMDPTEKTGKAAVTTGVKEVQQQLEDLLVVRGYKEGHIASLKGDVTEFCKMIDQAVAENKLDSAEAIKLKFKAQERLRDVERIAEERKAGKDTKAISAKDFNSSMDQALKGKTAQEIEAMMNA